VPRKSSRLSRLAGSVVEYVNSSINFKTPYYLKYNIVPNLDNIKIFGSLAYYKEPNAFIKKLDSKATPYYLVGFIGSNIYKLCNPKTNKIITSRDCKIIEGYYYKPNNSSNIQKIFTKLEEIKDSTPKELETSSKDTSKSSSAKPSKEPNKTISSKVIEELEDNSEDELALPTSSIIEEKDSNSILSTIELDNSKQDWKSLYNKAIISNILSTNVFPMRAGTPSEWAALPHRRAFATTTRNISTTQRPNVLQRRRYIPCYL
jgi:hypothetical protein